jgi:hypothetical protein
MQGRRNWFKLKESFPREHLLVRNEYGEPLRTIYLANAVVKVSFAVRFPSPKQRGAAQWQPPECETL